MHDSMHFVFRLDIDAGPESAAASGTVRPSFSMVGRSIDDWRFTILMGLASLAVGPCSPDPPRYDCPQRDMTFIEDMRTRLLGAKRVLGNIRNSVVAISDAIAYNLADGISRLSVDSIITPWRQRTPCLPVSG